MHRVRISSTGHRSDQYGMILSLPELAIRGQQWSHSDFSLHKLIGKGRIGTVHLATYRRTGEQMALKVLEKSRLTDQRRIWLEEELCLLQKLFYDNIIRIRGWFEDGPSFFVMLEYAENLDILQYIRSLRLPSMKLEEATSVTRQMMGALAHLHERGIRHRNIVASNVLLKPAPSSASSNGSPSVVALLSGFSCTIVVRKTSRRCLLNSDIILQFVYIWRTNNSLLWKLI
ncbi:hypothetical protein BIW11_10388 [Tropilaelaps mercedesae]|uniref:Protein kinase domain-containing protein n=1 Tax=Tropilaelaps mercedesae TaxID=418985 RepID=A0A1V9XGC7_9ACAR|nr:hypothetical protein BIW11_10388 [Tropilaelaps mercedesae]